jgi:hypothetical protein
VAANCATHELASGLCEIEQTLACGGCKTMRHLDDTHVRGHTAEPDKTNASVCPWARSQTLPVPRGNPAPLSVPCRTFTAGSWYAWPSTHVGYELIGAAMLILGRRWPLPMGEDSAVDWAV